MILPPARYGLRMLVERKLGAVDVCCEVYSFDEIVSLAKRGLGVGIVPVHVAREQADHLRIVEGAPVDLSRQIMLLTHRGRKMAESAISFIDLLKARGEGLDAERR
jgi:DNA-binding transcriptional LysR family regulator